MIKKIQMVPIDTDVTDPNNIEIKPDEPNKFLSSPGFNVVVKNDFINEMYERDQQLKEEGRCSCGAPTSEDSDGRYCSDCS